MKARLLSVVGLIMVALAPMATPVAAQRGATRPKWSCLTVRCGKSFERTAPPATVSMTMLFFPGQGRMAKADRDQAQEREVSYCGQTQESSPGLACE